MYFAKAMAFPLRTSSGDRGQHSAVLTVNFPPQISANTQLNSAQTRWRSRRLQEAGTCTKERPRYLPLPIARARRASLVFDS